MKQKKLVSCAISVFVLVLLGSLLLSVYTVVKDKGRGPRIQLENAIFDMGQLVSDERKEFYIYFKNVGNEKLRIEKVIAGCNCIGALLEGKEYAPGQTGRIHVSYHATDGPGRYIRHLLYISSNDKSMRVSKVYLVGQMTPYLLASPRSVEFGEIPLGRASERSIILLSLGPEDVFSIKSITTNINRADVTASQTERVDWLSNLDQVGNAFRFILHVRKDAAAGAIEGEVLVNTTSKLSKTITIPVHGDVVSSLEYKPRLLFFVLDKHSENPDQSIEIASRYPVTIVPQEANHPVKCTSDTLAPSQNWVFHCSPTDDASPGHRGSLGFTIQGHPYEKNLFVPYRIENHANKLCVQPPISLRTGPLSQWHFEPKRED